MTRQKREAMRECRGKVTRSAAVVRMDEEARKVDMLATREARTVIVRRYAR